MPVVVSFGYQQSGVEAMNTIIPGLGITVAAAMNTGRPTFAYCLHCGLAKHETATGVCYCQIEAK